MVICLSGPARLIEDPSQLQRGWGRFCESGFGVAATESGVAATGSGVAATGGGVAATGAGVVATGATFLAAGAAGVPVMETSPGDAAPSSWVSNSCNTSAEVGERTAEPPATVAKCIYIVGVNAEWGLAVPV